MSSGEKKKKSEDERKRKKEDKELLVKEKKGITNLTEKLLILSSEYKQKLKKYKSPSKLDEVAQVEDGIFKTAEDMSFAIKESLQAYKKQKREVHGTSYGRKEIPEPAPDYMNECTGTGPKQINANSTSTDASIKTVDNIDLKQEIEKLKRENEQLKDEKIKHLKDTDILKSELRTKDDVKLETTRVESKPQTRDKQTSTDEATLPQNQENKAKVPVQGMHDKKSENESEATTCEEKQKALRDISHQNQLESDIKEYQLKIDKLTTELNTSKKLEMQRKSELQELEAKLQKEWQNKSIMESEMKKLSFEKNEALTRLSEIAGRRLLDNNPSIADLSTEIRPTKIGENFKQLYDNEWTEAFEELTEEGKKEDECIKSLLQIVKDTFTCAMGEAENFETKLSTIVSSFPENSMTPHKKTTKDEEELIKQLKRVSAARTSTSVQDMYVKKLEKKKDVGERLKSYVRKCMELCWYMAVQSPPMAIVCDVQQMGPFDDKHYMRYTATGDLFDFVVWPCTLLHDRGPILAKGVAQATKGRAPSVPKQDFTDNTSKSMSSKISDPAPQKGIIRNDTSQTSQKRVEENKAVPKFNEKLSRTQGGPPGQRNTINRERLSQRDTKSLYVEPSAELSGGGLARSQSQKHEDRKKFVSTIDYKL